MSIQVKRIISVDIYPSKIYLYYFDINLSPNDHHDTPNLDQCISQINMSNHARLSKNVKYKLLTQRALSKYQNLSSIKPYMRRVLFIKY